MDAATFWSSLAPLGMVRLVVRTPVGLIEVDRALERPQLSERFVNFPGRPIDLHFFRGMTYQLEFHDGYHEHTGRVEHGIIARDAAGNELFSLFLVRPSGSEEHDPAQVAAFRAFRDRVKAAAV
ncbi:MAG: hypothetical protein RMM58_13745 [Chloroflexota bacterium]|nr:hemin-degrading factor [Dehalococcoidia bacterium]MDW8254934.1 hypothetical protein [Chloroflexota bacterium]